MNPGITVAIPHVPGRERFLGEALASIGEQTRRPEAVAIATDLDAEGEAVTRNRALDMVRTEFVAFLDDDDRLLPSHLLACASVATETDADLVYPWFIVEGGTDPFPQWFDAPFDPQALRQANYIPVTTLVRTELALSVGGFPDPDRDAVYPSRTACVDWAFLLRLVDAGAKFAHVPERTWIWRHHGGNLSGRTWR